MILYVIKGTVFHLIFEKKKGETFFSRGTSPKNKKSWEKKSDDVSYFGEGGGGRAKECFCFSERANFCSIDRSIERTNERASITSVKKTERKEKRTLYASFEDTTGGTDGEILRVRERSFLCRHFRDMFFWITLF